MSTDTEEEVIVHGYGAYSTGRCRCEVCRAAKAAYMREQRANASRNARTGWVVDGVRHGTRNAYEVAGCRCGQCVARKRQYWRGEWAQRRRQRRAA